MHLILLRHGSRADKAVGSDDVVSSDSATWLSPFDPPLNLDNASRQVELAVKKIKSNLKLEDRKNTSVIIHSSPYNRCVQTSELLIDSINRQRPESPKAKLRIDQALSEWLHDNFETSYLPPNDDGVSMVSNINKYMHAPDKEALREAKDPLWMYNKLGKCGVYGETLKELKRRCFKFLSDFLQYYDKSLKSSDDKNIIIVIVAHGAIVSTLLQILLGRPIYNEIPLATPLYFKQSSTKRTVFNMVDYDNNVSSILSISNDRDLHSLLRTPIDLNLLELDSIYEDFEPSLPATRRGRPRSSTYQPPSIALHGNTSDEEPLQHSHSSRQLRSLQIPSDGESAPKVLDVAKLATYFGGYSGSDSESESESESEDESPSYNDVLSMTAPPRVTSPAVASPQNGLSAFLRKYGVDEDSNSSSTDTDSEFVLGFGDAEPVVAPKTPEEAAPVLTERPKMERAQSVSQSVLHLQEDVDTKGVIDGTFSNFYFDTPQVEKTNSSSSFLEYLKKKKPQRAITIISTMFNTSTKTRPTDVETATEPRSSSESGDSKRYKTDFGCYNSPAFAKSEDDGNWFGGNFLQKV